MNSQATYRIILRGGLGNQLFQYFAARELAEKASANLVLDASLLPASTRNSKRKPSEFGEEISSFFHDGEIINNTKTGSLLDEAQRWIQIRFAQYLRSSGKNQVRELANFRHFSGSDPLETMPVFKGDRNLLINHPFLNPAIFSYPKGESVRDLQSLTNPTSWFSGKKAEILLQRPLAIHHRLGDHVHLGTPASLDYITKAISTLESRLQSGKILVFTDDIVKSKEILYGLPFLLDYINPPIHSRPLESLVLMASCRALVMSRSSFSWWAATLGQHSGLVSVINRTWLDKPSTPEFFTEVPDAWLRV